MAKVTVKMPDAFIKKMNTLGSKTDEITATVLKAGGEVVLDKVKNNLEGVIGKNTKVKSRSTGELLSSLGMSDVKLDRKGDSNLKIGFAEPRKDGDSIAKIANILEYGKHGQPAKPFLKPAMSSTKKACITIMESTLDEEVKKL